MQTYEAKEIFTREANRNYNAQNAKRLEDGRKWTVRSQDIKKFIIRSFEQLIKSRIINQRVRGDDVFKLLSNYCRYSSNQELWNVKRIISELNNSPVSEVLTDREIDTFKNIFQLINEEDAKNIVADYTRVNFISEVCRSALRAGCTLAVASAISYCILSFLVIAGIMSIVSLGAPLITFASLIVCGLAFAAATSPAVIISHFTHDSKLEKVIDERNNQPELRYIVDSNTAMAQGSLLTNTVNAPNRENPALASHNLIASTSPNGNAQISSVISLEVPNNNRSQDISHKANRNSPPSEPRYI